MSLGDEDDDPSQSSFKLEISLAIGYQRRRARLASQLEANVTSLVLLVAGVAVVLLFLYWLLSRLGTF